MFKTICFALAAVFAGSAAAQSSARPDPADPATEIPSRPYESAFKGYRRFADPEIARWRDVNDDMARLGGHRGHVKGDQGTAREQDAKPKAPAGRGGHK